MTSYNFSPKKTCVFCNGSYQSRRSHSQYCSANCRSKARYARQRSEKAVSSHVLTRQQLSDVETIKTYSWEAARAVIEIATFCGRDMAEKVLDGMWDLLVQTGARDPVPMQS
jgi:reverse gyrase